LRLRSGSASLSACAGGYCNQNVGDYTATPDQICGGGAGTWGETRLQVWRRAPPLADDAELQMIVALMACSWQLQYMVGHVRVRRRVQ
jgi:hypothetical protein